MRNFQLVCARVSVAIGLFVSGVAVAQSLSHDKYTLDNGLTVILHEDRTLPVVSVNLWYRVGAKNEPPKRSGFAHLFEHLMFMGTKRVPGSEFDTLMESGGGANNASTSLDRTNYFSWGPSSLLPTLLWLDADRMEDLGAMMDQRKLDLQRNVVRNELRQVVENTPYAKTSEAVYQALYPVGHPYHFGVIGTHEDLEAATVTNVTDFFATFYVPNNCSLVVAGDFDSKAVKPLISSLFGSIPRGKEPPKVEIPRPVLPGVVRETHRDQIQQPKVGFYYHSPATYAEGDAEMLLLSMVLADGPSSRLYQRLVLGEQLAVDVRAFQEGATLGSVFGVEVTAKPDADLARVEAIMDEELAKVLAGDVKDDELTPRKNVVEFGLVSALQDLGRRADRLNEYEYFFGNPDSLAADVARFQRADAAKVTAWAKKVVTPAARLVQHVLPAGEGLSGEEEPVRAASDAFADTPAIPAKGIGERPPSPRDAKPQDFASAAWTSPKPEEFRLSNGMRVLLYARPQLPLVSMQALFVQPTPLDEPKHAGRSAMVATMLEEGTARLATGEFAQAVQALGATYGTSVEANAIGVTMTSVKKNMAQAAELWSEAIRTPRFAQEDWSRVKQNHIEELKQELDEPGATASRVGALALFGPGNPYAWPVAGSIETCAALSLDDVKNAYRSMIDAQYGVVIVAGDTTRAEASAILERCFASFKPKAAAATPDERALDFSIPRRDAMQLIIVHRPDSTQTMVHFRAPAFAYGDARRVPLRALNTVLGGSFTSRLNANLREKHGYTYGARSAFLFAKELGAFQAGAAVNAEATGPAITEFLNEFARLRAAQADVSPAEVRKAVQTLRTEAIQSFGTLGGTINAAGDLLQLGQPLDRLDADLSALSRVDAESLNTMAKDALRLDEGVLVLVGDSKIIMEQIKGLKLPAPVFMDAEGKVVK